VSRGRAFFRAKAGKRDGPHAAIRDGLRKLGHFVVDCAGLMDGTPDLCVYPRARWVQLSSGAEGLDAFPLPVWLEVKVAKGRMRETQLSWHAAALNAGVRVAVVRTLDEAHAALGAT
jgi:hypothetical protein